MLFDVTEEKIKVFTKRILSLHPGYEVTLIENKGTKTVAEWYVTSHPGAQPKIGNGGR
jgi:tRNA A37 threonylcarbamoyladenosine dehydratase